MRRVMVGVQRLTSEAAIGAAKAGQRLASIARETKQTSEAVGSVTTATGRLREDVQRIAESSQQTQVAATRMRELTENGTALSREAVESAARLQAQMRTTSEQFAALLDGVKAITQVSQVIDEIARHTRILSFNAAIEAARAGTHGSGFAVVANEVRTLAERTAAQTGEIRNILDKIAEGLEPARAAMQESGALVETTTTRSQTVGQALEDITGLARDVAGHMESIASAAGQQQSAVDTVFEELQKASASCRTTSEQVKEIGDFTTGLARITDAAFHHFALLDGRTRFHRVLGLAGELAAATGQIFERVIAEGRCRLEDVLALEYVEIKGREIATLSRLFDTSRIPPEGPKPPKYRTRYDGLVDLELQRVMDDVRAKEPSLQYAIVLDLNGYAPSHNREYCADWTGDYARDLERNRVKRFFTNSGRVGLGEAALQLPKMATRDDYVKAGYSLRKPATARDEFLVSTYLRDTGAGMNSLALPLYVGGHRYGAVALGWAERETD